MQRLSPKRRISKHKPTIGTPKASPQTNFSNTTRNSRKSEPPRHRRLLSAGKKRNLPVLTETLRPKPTRALSLVSSQKIGFQQQVKASTSRKPSPLAVRNPVAEAKSLYDSMQLPITPSLALKSFQDCLSSFQQGEILEYSEIYYLGLGAAKVKTKLMGKNFGFDDQRGDYVMVRGDHICYRYEVLEVIGKGSFGQVFKCFDHKSKEFQALKIIRNKKRFHRQGAIQVKILELIRIHDQKDKANIIRMNHHFSFRRHLCITFQLLSMNLYQLMKSNSYQGFSLGLIKRFAIQILCSLHFSKELKIIHCDLKPENILLKHPKKSGIKVIDFGSACLENQKLYTYIQSRFYRAPEIILGIPYTTSIDIWSLGCILAQLYMGYPLFPGENQTQQLLCIVQVLGIPPDHVLEKSQRKKNFFDIDGQIRVVPNSRGRLRNPGTRSLESKIKCPDNQFLDFLEKCLDWDHRTRISPSQALEHDWIRQELKRRSSLN